LSTNTRNNSHTSNTSDKTPSKYRIIKDGWGNRANFQALYGLKMTPEDLEEGNAILQAMQEADREEALDQ